MHVEQVDHASCDQVILKKRPFEKVSPLSSRLKTTFVRRESAVWTTRWPFLKKHESSAMLRQSPAGVRGRVGKQEEHGFHGT